MEQSLPVNNNDKRTRGEKMLDTAAELDAEFGGTDYVDAVNDYLGIKKIDAATKKAKAELEAKKKAFAKKLSESIPSQNLADPRSRNQKLIDDAKELDSQVGGNQYERQARAYIDSAKPMAQIIKEGLIEAGYFKEVNGKKQVDWKKVTTAGKTTQEVVDAVKAHVEKTMPNSRLGALLPIIMKQVDTIVSEKKAAAVKAKINQITRYRARRITNIFRRNTRIENLVEIWKQGGLSEKAILEKLGEDFGFTQFTDENEKWIEN
jgi:hypothetical protein